MTKVELMFTGTNGIKLAREMLRQIEQAVADLEKWKAGTDPDWKNFSEGCGRGVYVPEGVKVEVSIR
jgi:hypothetical protein